MPTDMRRSQGEGLPKLLGVALNEETLLQDTGNGRPEIYELGQTAYENAEFGLRPYNLEG